MDWFTALALGFGLEARRQKKEQQKQAETISTYRSEIFQAMFALDSLLSDLSFSNILAMEQKDLTDLEELAPLFPIAEILSMQGYISPEQRLFLQDYINFKSPRFNLGQFTKAAIGREGVYPQWHALTGLDSTYCGQIWHTLIELICRQRAPEVMQQAVDLLGKILYLFWFFACTDMEPAQIRYKKIISNLIYTLNGTKRIHISMRSCCFKSNWRKNMAEPNQTLFHVSIPIRLITWMDG